MGASEQFLDAIREAGLNPPETIEADGKLRRFSSNGNSGDDAGWYVLHGDGIPAGAFGDWRIGLSQTWRADIGRPLTRMEEAEHRATVESVRQDREGEEIRRRAEAATKALAIWEASQPAPANHSYLIRKHIQVHGARIHNDALVIPLRDGSRVHSLQLIGPNGRKRFLPGGRVTGCYFSIGDPKDTMALCITEGFATGASVHEATGYPVAVAFNAGNLKAVALVMRAKFPDLKIILCADDDVGTVGNPGVAKAQEAAEAVRGFLAMPDFGGNRPNGASDFNDMLAICGAQAVVQAIANAQSLNDNKSDLVYRRVADVEAKPIKWLWPDRIACGKLTIIAGNPGLGKSQLTASLAAILSGGGTWPVDVQSCEPGAAIILSAEDDAEDTIRPRLEAAGADLQRCFVLDAVTDTDKHGTSYRRTFSLKRDIERLGKLLAELKDVRLVIVDPISAYLDDVDSHKNAEIRTLLAPLGALASKHSVAVVAVTHFNKAASQDALLRVMGSLAFVAAARAAYAVIKDQADPSRRLFLPLKNNIGREVTGYAFSVDGVTLANSIETSRITWESGTVTVTADEAMASVINPDERSEIDDAKDFLESLLADGPVPVKRVQQEAKDGGYSWATVKRASKELQISKAKDGMKGPWQWSQSPKVLKTTEDAHHKKVSAFGEDELLRQPKDGWENLF